MAQHFYGNVSVWMIQMESELKQQPGMKMKLDVEIQQRAALFMKVQMLSCVSQTMWSLVSGTGQLA